MKTQSTSLDAILTGRTCSPLSLAEFRSYLTNQEFSVENLDFLEWLHAYRINWSRLDKELQELSPPANTDPYLPFISVNSDIKDKDAISPPDNEIDSLASIPPPTKTMFSSDNFLQNSSFTPPPVTSLSHPLKAATQSYRAEVNHVISRHFLPGSSHELNLEALVRTTICQDVLVTTHPSIFDRAERDVRSMLESVSLERFSDMAVRNINPRTRKLRWCLATASAILGIAIEAVIFTLKLPRWWRLISFPLCVWTIAVMLTARSGICTYLTYIGQRQYQDYELIQDNESGVKRKRNRHEKTKTVDQAIRRIQSQASIRDVTLAVIISIAISVGILFIPI